MENQRIIRSRGIEVNTMTILDASGFKKDTQDLIDDSAKMCEAIFEILKDDNSLELIMASYRLLTELDKHFPREYASKVEKSELPSPSSVPELVVVEDV
ncbi:hypothetical protein C3L33_22633, partial [Rhododendron williamsianum]